MNLDSHTRDQVEIIVTEEQANAFQQYLKQRRRDRASSSQASQRTSSASSSMAVANLSEVARPSTATSDSPSDPDHLISSAKQDGDSSSTTLQII